MIDWGDVPTWVGAVGTVGAAFWAVYLYSRGQHERRQSNARLLSPLGPITFLTVPAGQVPDWPGETIVEGVAWRPSENGLVIKDPAEAVHLHLVSDSPEMFVKLRSWLVLPSSETVNVAMAWSTLAPHEARNWTVLYPQGTLEGGRIEFKVWFTDSAGRDWERSSMGVARRRKRSERVALEDIPLPIPTAYLPHESGLHTTERSPARPVS